jgi:hypothetical protein
MIAIPNKINGKKIKQLLKPATAKQKVVEYRIKGKDMIIRIRNGMSYKRR